MGMAMHLNSMAKKIISCKQLIQCPYTKGQFAKEKISSNFDFLKRKELKIHETIEFKWMRIILIGFKNTLKYLRNLRTFRR